MACILENCPADVSKLDRALPPCGNRSRAATGGDCLPRGPPGARTSLERRLSLGEDLKTRTMSL